MYMYIVMKRGASEGSRLSVLMKWPTTESPLFWFLSERYPPNIKAFEKDGTKTPAVLESSAIGHRKGFSMTRTLDFLFSCALDT